jgi:sterol desaturase/sphingolipid hydroxylase (fatty acid hydroxylase superfamily)
MTLALAVALGILTWSFLEYVIHRWLGHDRRLVKKTIFGREHTMHHAKGDYFATIGKKFVASVLFLAVAAPPAMLLVGTEHGLAWAGGLVGFYLVYEILHRLLHVWEGIGPYARWARRHHFHHHFGDPRTNHGVTSPIWDIVFGTHAPATRIVVPEKLAMRWLRDPQTGAIRTDLGPTWVVRPARQGGRDREENTGSVADAIAEA